MPLLPALVGFAAASVGVLLVMRGEGQVLHASAREAGAFLLGLVSALPLIVYALAASLAGTPAPAAGAALAAPPVAVGLLFAPYALILPGILPRRAFRLLGLVALAAAALLWICILDGALSLLDGGLLLLAPVLAVALSAVRTVPAAPPEPDVREGRALPLFFSGLLLVFAGMTLAAFSLPRSGILSTQWSNLSCLLAPLSAFLPRGAAAVRRARKKERALDAGPLLLCLTFLFSLVPATAAFASGEVALSAFSVSAYPLALLAAAVCVLPAALTGRLRRLAGLAAAILFVAAIVFALPLS